MCKLTQMGQFQSTIAKKSKGTHVLSSQARFSHDLQEKDWLYVADYLNETHIYPLFWLSLSSHETTSRQNIIKPKNAEANTSWVMLLHSLNDDILQKVFEMVSTGNKYVQNEYSKYLNP